MSTPAERFQAAALRLLRRFGTEMTFRRYVPTKDKRKGSQAPVLTGDPVPAIACLLSPEESRDRGVAAGDQVLLVDGTAFPAGLNDRWTVDWGIGEVSLSPPVTAARSEPSAPAAYYEALVKTGGQGVAPAS